MDVVRLFFSCIFAVTLVACAKSSKEGEGQSKAAGAGCPDLALQKEKIVRFKNGRVSRIVLKQKGQLEDYVDKHKNEIDFVEDNYKVYIPKDQSLELMGWGSPLNWGTTSMQADKLWTKNIYGQGVIVAVIDSGIDRTHPQLRNQLYINPKEVENGVDDDGNGLIDDINGYDFTADSGSLFDTTGHGTHVSGIIAADNSQGSVKGVAPQSKILVYDFFGPNGEGSVFDAIKALKYAADAGAKVINASWGGPGCSLALKSAIDDLSNKNILFVAAAGNEGQNIDTSPSYPAAFKALAQITVGAMTEERYTAGFSNYGNLVHLVAPGAGIISTVPGGGQAAIKSENGTSMATPFVSGAAALLMSAFPQAKASEIKNAILQSVEAGPYPVFSRGSLDVHAAYLKLREMYPENSSLR